MPNKGELGPLLRKAKDGGWARYIKTAADEAALLEGCYVDLDEAAYVAEFFARFLRHSKGEWAGQPFKLMDWQREDVITPLFGWKRPDGARRFRIAHIELPKKNGKSSLGAAIGIFLLVGDGEPGPEVYSAATDRDQASIVHGEAIHMVEASPQLLRRLSINRATKTISYAAENGWYRALSSEAAGKEGLNIHGVIIDELHVWRNRELFDAIKYGGAARRQPLTFIITTAGVFDPASLGWEQHEHAKRLLDGDVLRTDLFAYIRAADAEDDWTDEAVWKKANPAYGVIIKPEEMRAACLEAQEIPRLQNAFRRYRLNQWTEQLEHWLSVEDWDECAGEFDDSELAGQRCYAGLDLSTTTDLTAWVEVYPGPGPWKVRAHFWAPADGAEKRQRRDNVPYLTWAEQGFLTLTPGSVVDYERIRAWINERAKLVDIAEIAIDRWNSTQLQTQLDADGFTVVQFGQGYFSMSAPSKEFERRLLERSIQHDSNPVLRWMIGNAATETDPAGNIKPSKRRSAERIDGVVAAIMALGRAMVQPEEKEPVYERRGILTM